MANQVFVSDLSVTMKLANKGISLRVVDGDNKLRGYLRISKAYIRWQHGKEKDPRKQVRLNDFIDWAEDRKEAL